MKASYSADPLVRVWSPKTSWSDLHFGLVSAIQGIILVVTYGYGARTGDGTFLSQIGKPW